MYYKVKRYFKDLQDDKHLYKAGDIYPRKGVEASQARIAELLSINNRQGIPLIESVEGSPKADKKSAKENEKPVETSVEVEKSAETPAYTEETLAAMSKNEIKAVADAQGIELTGTSKADIIAEILAAQK